MTRRCYSCGSTDVTPPSHCDLSSRCVECGQGHGVWSDPRNPSSHLTVYLGTPANREQCEAARGMPVLLSYAAAKSRKYLHREFGATFSRILIDSGAYSELNSGVKVDLSAYADWCRQWLGIADAIAGLDDIGGDWKRSLANYEAFEWGFPTFHDSDPPDLLDDLIPLARARGGWIGIGLLPPRTGKEQWLRSTLARIPADLHVHGWALRAYTHLRRIDSVDSTNWFRDAWDLRNKLPWLTYGETLEIIVKRYQRERRFIQDEEPEEERDLFSSLPSTEGVTA